MAKSPDNTGKIQGNTRFKKGQSGNPSGRPRGSLNKATLAVQALLDGEAEIIGKKAIELANNGDMAAVKLVMERIIPPVKELPVYVENMGDITGTQDITATSSQIFKHVCSGNITLSEGKSLMSVLGGVVKSIEIEDIAARLEMLEEKLERDVGR